MMVDGGEEAQLRGLIDVLAPYTNVVTSRFSHSIRMSSLALPYAIWRASPVDH